MEEPLDKALATLLLKPNTTGAMVVDKNGLCLALKGTATEKGAGEEGCAVGAGRDGADIGNSGFAKLLAERAKLLGEGGHSVCIETDVGSILLEESGGNVVVLYRNAEAQ
jgi:hypothetical protein